MAEKTYKDVIEQKRQEMLNTLVESMETNPTAWQKGWFSVGGFPKNGLTGKGYTGINALYLAVLSMKKGYKDPRWVTFNQAHELGATIKSGEKAASVFFYREYDKNTRKDFDPRTLDNLSVEEQSTYMKENVRKVLKYSMVFNAEQCENFPALKHQEMPEEERKKRDNRIETIIRNSAAPIYQDGGNSAYYNPATDSIHLPKFTNFKTTIDYYATALHEIAHSTGHESRLNRDLLGAFGSESYAMEELRAELSSVFMQVDLNINLEGAEVANHAAYCRSWLTAIRDNPNVLFEAAKDASKITNYIQSQYLHNTNTTKSAIESTGINIDENKQRVAERNDRLLAAKTTAEKIARQKNEAYVVIEWSEHGAAELQDGTVLSFARADELLSSLNDVEADKLGYCKTKLHIFNPSYKGGEWYNDCRYDIGDEPQGGLKAHILEFSKTVSLRERQEIKDFVRTLKSKSNMTFVKKGEDYEIRHNIVEWGLSTADLPPDVRNAAIWLIENGYQTDEEVQSVFYSRLTSSMSDSFDAEKSDNKAIKAAYKARIAQIQEVETSLEPEVVVAVGNASTAPITAQEVVSNNNVPSKPAYAAWVTAKREKRLDNIEKNVPQEMKDLPNWCAFSTSKEANGSFKKKIWNCNVEGRKWAKSNDPTTWSSFAVALEYARNNGCDGLSFALTPESGIFCVDLDDCKVGGKYSETAWGIYNSAKQTYTERSVSGTGLHFFGKKAADVDFSQLGNKNTDSTFEYYDRSRFMSMTGDIFMRAKSELHVFSEKDKLVSIIKGKLPLKQELKPVSTFHNTASDDEVIERIKRSKKASEFNRMYAGEDICGDRNRTDLKMMNLLGFFTNGDAEQMKRIFENSGLYRANEKSRSYLDRTIQKALGSLYGTPDNFVKSTPPSGNKPKIGL